MKTSEILREAAWYHLSCNDPPRFSTRVQYSCCAIVDVCAGAGIEQSERNKITSFYKDLFTDSKCAFWLDDEIMQTTWLMHFEERQNFRAMLLFLAADIAEDQGD